MTFHGTIGEEDAGRKRGPEEVACRALPPAVDYRRHPSRHFLRPTQQDAPLPVENRLSIPLYPFISNEKGLPEKQSHQFFPVRGEPYGMVTVKI
jgi:hypothetical protein